MFRTEFLKPALLITLFLQWETCSCVHAQKQLTTDGSAKRDPVILKSDGSELLYVHLQKPTQLRLMRLSLTDQKSTPWNPAETRSEFEPAVSSATERMAYLQNRGNLSVALVIMDLSGKQLGEVPPAGGFSGMRSPAFSPDGFKVFFSYPEGSRQRIYSVDVEGKNRQTVVDSPGVNNWPSVSPDGKHLTFGSSRDDDFEIYRSAVDGSDLRRLTHSRKQDIRPRFSPDGSRIAFTSNRDGNYEIYVMDADGANVTRVTSQSGADDFACWFPDGKSLAIVSEHDGRYDLFQIAVP